MNNLYDYSEFSYSRAKAALVITEKLSLQGSTADALKFYDFQFKANVPTGPPADVLFFDPTGLKAAGLDFIRGQELDLFHNFFDRVDNEEFLIERIRTAATLIEALTKANDLSRVHDIYNSINFHKKSLKVTQARMNLVLAYFRACLKLGNIERAQEIFERDCLFLTECKDFPDFRASLGGTLMHALNEANKLDEAIQVHDDCILPRGRHASKEAKALVRSALIKIYSSRAMIEKAQKNYFSKSFQKLGENVPRCRASAALALAEHFLEAEIREPEKALKLHSQGHFSSAASEDRPRELKVLSLLTLNALEHGQLEDARKFVEEFPNTHNSKQNAEFRILSALALHEAYVKARDKEGISFIQSCVSKFHPVEIEILDQYCAEKGLNVDELLGDKEPAKS
jgi:hypothetical protein